MVSVGDLNTTATSDLNGSIVTFTSTGVRTTYSDDSVSLEVTANVIGEAKHELTVAGVTTKAISQFIGAFTELHRDINNLIEIITTVIVDSNSKVSVIARADGTAEHKVSVNGKESMATSKIEGASTVINTTGQVETTAGQVDDGNGYDTKAVVTTQSDGKTTTRFIKVSRSNPSDISAVVNTLKASSSFALGTNVEISKIGGTLYIKIIAPLDENLVIE